MCNGKGRSHCTKKVNLKIGKVTALQNTENQNININHFEDEGSRGENDDLRIFYIELSWLKNHMKECHLPYGRKEMSQFTQNDFVREKCWR